MEEKFVPYIEALESRKALPSGLSLPFSKMDRQSLIEIIYRLDNKITDKTSTNYLEVLDGTDGWKASYLIGRSFDMMEHVSYFEIFNKRTIMQTGSVPMYIKKIFNIEKNYFYELYQATSDNIYNYDVKFEVYTNINNKKYIKVLDNSNTERIGQLYPDFKNAIKIDTYIYMLPLENVTTFSNNLIEEEIQKLQQWNLIDHSLINPNTLDPIRNQSIDIKITKQDHCPGCDSPQYGYNIEFVKTSTQEARPNQGYHFPKTSTSTLKLGIDHEGYLTSTEYGQSVNYIKYHIQDTVLSRIETEFSFIESISK